MWELIRANKRKSLVLFIVMGICLVLLGYLVGQAFAPPDGGIAGVFLALLVWGILSLISYFQGDSIMLSLSGAREVKAEVHPQLSNVVEEMKIAAGLPKMPRIFIIDDPAPNAFATGRKPENCAIAVTTGLLARLNRDELQGVIAHETSHVFNRDIMFMTFAGIMLGSIVLISQIFLRGMWFTGGSRRHRSRSSSRDGGQAEMIIMVVAIVFAILAPIAARLLYFAISRQREYLADASAVRLTRYPEGLASALEKISSGTADLTRASKAMAPMYIVNPFKKKGRRLADITSTHPPISERIRILRALSQGASLANYQAAFNQITGSRKRLIPQSELETGTEVPLRPTAPAGAEAGTSSQRDLGDLLRAVNKYAFLGCACGLRIKLPPNFKKPSFACPRCNRELKVPIAELAAIATVAAGLDQKSAAHETGAPPETVYHRRGSGWESFACSCGQVLQLSPAFTGSQVTCSNCGRNIKVE